MLAPPKRPPVADLPKRDVPPVLPPNGVLLVRLLPKDVAALPVFPNSPPPVLVEVLLLLFVPNAAPPEVVFPKPPNPVLVPKAPAWLFAFPYFRPCA